MSKAAIGFAAVAMLVGVGIANAQTPAPAVSGATSRENVPGAPGVGTAGPASQATAAAKAGGSTKTEQPPEGEEGTRRPGSQAPVGNPPVTK